VEERRKTIKEWSEKIYAELQRILPNCSTEADFRRCMDPLLEEFCHEIDVDPLPQAEYTVATGRIDAVFNRLVIEYERPGVLKGNNQDQATRHATGQVKNYIDGLSKKERHRMDRLGGVAFDGRFLIFIRFVDGQWIEEPPCEVNVHSLERFLTWLSGLSSGLALTAKRLEQDFSIEQLRTHNILRSLYEALSRALEQKERSAVSFLFEQWRMFFSEAIDYSEAFGGRKLEPLKKWARRAGITITTSQEAERFFFVLHTYFALLAKFLAWLTVSRHLGVKIGSPSFETLASADTETLHSQLEKMENGGIFRDYGILNLLEGDFFSWYLKAWDARLEDALREMLKRLQEYDPTTLRIIPEETRDLFKKVYQYLLPQEIRHNLGEYYTPDWLAQWLLNQVDREFFENKPQREKLLKTRFLDPACGSGTFLVLIITRMRELARELFVSEKELLETILKNVVGFDLNPLAVLTARVNYLLNIADLLDYRRGEITIPVYLADSVRTPAEGENLFTAGTYRFSTAAGDFHVPTSLCTKELFDRFCDILEESVRAEMLPESFLTRVEKELRPPDWTDKTKVEVRELYQQILMRHKEGKNGLWARLLKNNSAPLVVGKFDYIVGNPPWVNWENLPDGYRQEIKPIWEHFGLFPHGGMDTILGKGKKDISMLMTYTVVDGLLKDSGKLGFVITQSVFKTSGAGQGFRWLSIPCPGGGEVPLKVVHVDDMVSLQPFEGASNRTAVVILEKGKPTTYPVPYTLWRKVKGARFTYDSTLKEVTEATRRLDFAAEPVDPEDPTSPWLTARPRALEAIRKILGRSDYEAHAGAYTGGANAVYWVNIVYRRPDGLVVVRNITEGAKVKVSEVTEPIEPDLLYPLLRGRDVKRWVAKPSAFILMVQDPIKRCGIDENKLQTYYPCTYGYLKQFESVLRERAAFKRYFTRKEKNGSVTETGPFYSMFNVGDYTFAPWKVVWREQASSMTTSVIDPKDDKPVIPDHKLMLVDCTIEEEAHYVCGLLNSILVATTVLGYAVEIQMDPHVLEHIRIPRYDSENFLHRHLAELSKRAHEAAQHEDTEALKRIEEEIDKEAARLWGLTEEELRDVQQSLKELEAVEPEKGEEEDEDA